MEAIKVNPTKVKGRYVSTTYILAAPRFEQVLPRGTCHISVERDERAIGLPAAWAKLMADGASPAVVQMLHELFVGLFIGRHVAAIELTKATASGPAELQVHYADNACPRWKASLNHRHGVALRIIEQHLTPPS